MRRLTQLAMLIVCGICASSCAHRFVNRINSKIDRYDPVQHGRMGLQRNPHNRQDLAVMLAFSGGGTRAAALSYGVLEALHDLDVPGDQGGDYPMLDEVDYLSTVSGGSFTGAYYALYGDRIFTDFPQRFLYHNVQWSLIWRLMLPWNWLRLFSGEYGRTDFAAEYYDKTIFQGATFQTLREQGVAGIAIQSTDLVEATRFGFTPDFFGRICSDWSKFPVAGAVAASSAFPGPFGAITLNNFAGACDFTEEKWIQTAIDRRDTTTREFYMAKSMRSYQNKKAKPFIHLLDGGIADNLGLRGPLESTLAHGGYVKALKDKGRADTRKLALIVVNAQTDTSRKWAMARLAPGLMQMIDAVSTIMINRYNFETIELTRSSMRDWAQELRVQLGVKNPEKNFYLIEVSLNALQSDEERETLCALPTALHLPKNDVDHLRYAAKRVLYDNPEFQRLVSDLGGKIPERQPATAATDLPLSQP